MKTFHSNVPLGLKIQEVLGWIGLVAQSEKTAASHKAAVLCADIGMKIDPEETVTIQIPIVHILCQLCDYFRSVHDSERVKKVEEVVKLLKGQEERIIQGTISLNPTSINQLDDQLEHLRKIIVSNS